MIWLYYRIGLNEVNSSTTSSLFDLELREIATLIPLVVLVFLIGLQPEILLSYMHVTVDNLIEQVHISSIIENYTFYDTLDRIIHNFKSFFIG